MKSCSLRGIFYDGANKELSAEIVRHETNPKEALMPIKAQPDQPPPGGTPGETDAATPANAAAYGARLRAARDDCFGLVGVEIGGCRIERQLGRGAMGAVYLGHHRSLDLMVAVKILSPDYLEMEEENVERFLREARTCAKLQHPHIVSALNVGQEHGYYYMVMHYIDGHTLQAEIERAGALPVERAVAIVRQAAEALEEARRHQIVHRDIKPDNIMLDRDDQVKLTDLGLAKCLDEDKNLTQLGTTLGTPYYMSPEQAMDSLSADHRSDLYGLGCTFFHLVTGSVPYNDPSPLVVLSKHANAPLPDARALVPELPADLAAIIRRLMAKKPEDRYETAGDLIVDLDRFAAGQPLLEISTPDAPEEEDWRIRAGAKLLIVDDSAIMRQIMRGALKRLGALELFEAEDGAEALELIKRHRDLRLILCDINMPVMDGLTLLQQARKLKIHIPIVMITSESDKEVILNAVRMGANNYLTKPFTAEALLGRIISFLQ